MKAPEILLKSPFEERLFDFVFTDDLDTGETISASPAPIIAVTPTTASPLTFDPPTISGGIVQTKLKGGLDGTTYHVTCQIVTSTQKREGCGDLKVEAC